MMAMLRGGGSGMVQAVAGGAVVGGPLGAAAGAIASVPSVASSITKPMADMAEQRRKI